MFRLLLWAIFRSQNYLFEETVQYKTTVCRHVKTVSRREMSDTCSTVLLAMVIGNPLNAELNSICRLLALLGSHHIFHVSRIRVKLTRDK